RGRSDHAIDAQFLDLGRAVAGLVEDLLGVLTEGRRLALDAGAAVREPKPRADQAHRPEARVDRLHHVAVAQLRVRRDLLDFPDGRPRPGGGREPRLPGLGLVRGERVLDDLAERGLVVGTRSPILEAGIVERVRPPDGAHEARELLFGQHGQHDVAVAPTEPARRRRYAPRPRPAFPPRGAPPAAFAHPPRDADHPGLE